MLEITSTLLNHFNTQRQHMHAAFAVMFAKAKCILHGVPKSDPGGVWGGRPKPRDDLSSSDIHNIAAAYHNLAARLSSSDPA